MWEALPLMMKSSAAPGTVIAAGADGLYVATGHGVLQLTRVQLAGRKAMAAADFLKIPVQAVLVAHDEIDLPPGTMRLKQGGGHGGHNGLRDTHAHMGADYLRLRIGVGHPGNASEVVGYVLKRPSKDEEAIILRAIDDAADSFELLLKEGLQKAQTQLHSRQV